MPWVATSPTSPTAGSDGPLGRPPLATPERVGGSRDVHLADDLEHAVDHDLVDERGGEKLPADFEDILQARTFAAFQQELVAVEMAEDGAEVTNPIWEAIRDREDVFSGVFAYSRKTFDLASGEPVMNACTRLKTYAVAVDAEGEILNLS